MRHHLLHPWPDQTADYAMGWGIGRHETMGRIYTHAGSNTMWLSRVMLIPSEDTVVIVNASEYTAASRKATGALIDQITARVNVFSRAQPEDKIAIVQSLQRQGFVSADVSTNSNLYKLITHVLVLFPDILLTFGQAFSANMLKL